MSDGMLRSKTPFFWQNWFRTVKALSSISISTTLHCVDQVRHCDLPVPLAPLQILLNYQISLNLIRYYQIFSNRCDLVTYLSHLLLVTSSSSNIVIYCWKVGNISCWGLSKHPIQHFLYNICVINIIWSQNVKVSSCYKIKKIPNTPL